MSKYEFKQVDVFTTRAFFGNPVAVIVNAEGLSEAQMRQIAVWTNLSETTFVLPATSAEADYRLRIFTPKQELPFAGHPTVGSAHAVLESGIVKPTSSKLIMECRAGLMQLRIDEGGSEQRIFVQTPRPKLKAVDESIVDRLAAGLGAQIMQGKGAPRLVDVGPIWLIAQLNNAAEVHALRPDIGAIKELSENLRIAGVTVFGMAKNEQYAVYVRSFAPAHGIAEDPVCGSGNASVAAFLAETAMLDQTGSHYLANQGCEVGRNGFVSVTVDTTDMKIEIGGSSVTCIAGSIRA